MGSYISSQPCCLEPRASCFPASFQHSNSPIVTKWLTIGYCGRSKLYRVAVGWVSIKFPLSRQALTAMAPSNAAPRDDSVQVVDDVIDVPLIDNAAGSVGALLVRRMTCTEMVWTLACKELLGTYREKIHPSVRPASKNLTSLC